jgi:ribosomal protein S18 acetylase RimI-like enzyme
MHVDLLDPARIGELRPLYLGMHRHHRAVARVPVVADDDESWRLRRAWYAQMLGDGSAFVLAAEDGGALVGYALVLIKSGPDDTFPFGDHWAELVSLAVAEERRGAGIGTRLLDAVDAELQRRGVTGLEVAVMEGNDAALRLYERRGLRPGERILYRFGDGAAAPA